MTAIRRAFRMMLFCVMIPAAAVAGFPHRECHCGIVRCMSCDPISTGNACCCEGARHVPESASNDFAPTAANYTPLDNHCDCVGKQTLSRDVKSTTVLSPSGEVALDSIAEAPGPQVVSQEHNGASGSPHWPKGGLELLRLLGRWRV
jgi:hypothetical protein